MNFVRNLAPWAALAIISGFCGSAIAATEKEAPVPLDRNVPGFDANYYLSRYPDLRAVGSAPDALLDHFKKFGQNELRVPSAHGDPARISKAQWQAGCGEGRWGGIKRIVTYGKRNTISNKPTILSDVTHHLCDDNIYKLALAKAEMLGVAGSAHGKEFMRTGQHLLVDEYLVAADGKKFVIQQSDGNLCIYAGSGPKSRTGGNWWCTGRAPGNGTYFTTLQGDGNLCTYSGTPQSPKPGPLWCSRNTSLPADPGIYFTILQNDGNLATYFGSSPSNNWGWVWDRITTAPPKPDSFWESSYKGLRAVGDAMHCFELQKQGKPCPK